VVNFPVALQVQQTQSIRPALTGENQPSTGSQSTAGSRTPGGNQASSSAPRQTQISAIPTLKEGLSVSITITIEQKNNIILVPSRAVTRQGANSVVQVVKTENTTEQRIIKTGISDWQNVEVTEGLSEGEKLVVAKQATSTRTTTPSTNTQPARIPGLPQTGR
jgi:hypothetical protein